MTKKDTLTINHANHSDLDFIVNLIANDSRDQHYHAAYCDNTHLMQFRNALCDVINWGGIKRMVNNRVEEVASSLYIINLLSGERIGFTLLSEKQPGSMSTVMELYMISIAPSHRHKGYGKSIINCILGEVPHGVSLYARCYPASSDMCSLLANIGFKQIGVTPGGTLEFNYLKM
jgi:N-acetylglutamate synthase-like GNAT family acetyltransferase